MTKNYELNKKFAERLEWQLTTEYRRQSRFNNYPAKGRKHPYLRVAGLVLCSMLAGAFILKAVEGFKDSWKRELEMARVETTLQLKEARLKMVKEMIGHMKKQYAEGLMDRENWRHMEARGERAELELKKARIDFDEVKITGQAPRDFLFAPLVQGQDFVSQRLQLGKEWADLEFKLMKQHLARLKTMAAEKMASQRDVAPVENKVRVQEKLAAEIERRLKLRAEFLNGNITPQQVEVKEKLSVARVRYHQAEVTHRLLTKEMERMNSQVQKGVVSARNLGPMQYELIAAEAELRLARLELEVLEKQLPN